MRKISLLLVAFVMAGTLLSFHPAKKYMMTSCGYQDSYSAGVWAGHQEFLLQQQGYGNFEVYTWCSGGDFCPQLCVRIYYSYISMSGPVVSHTYKLQYRPADNETVEQLKARATKIE